MFRELDISHYPVRGGQIIYYLISTKYNFPLSVSMNCYKKKYPFESQVFQVFYYSLRIKEFRYANNNLKIILFPILGCI